jgi:outer membrane protein
MNLPTSHLRAPTTSVAKALLFTIAFPFAATWAQADANDPTGKPSSGGFVGLAVGSAATYQGSDQQRTAGQLIGEYRWANGVYVGGMDGLLGVELDVTPQLKLGLALGMDGGRKESDSRYLAGMGDIAAKGTVNASAKIALSEQWGVSTALQLGAGNTGKGGLLNLGASYSFPLAAATQLSLNLGASLANSDYMQDYFGVSASQASASGYRRYTPSAGLRDVSAGLSLNHQINRNWMFISGVSTTRLSNSAKDSPLVRKSTSQSAFASVAYSF